MVQRTAVALPDLYAEDETAWLDAMADRLAAGAYADLDYANLREYLTDMAQRDRREVESRLVVLAMHVLKWVHQPDRQTRGWRGSILEQQQELRRLAGRGVLRNHALASLAEAYQQAVERAAVETGLPREAFPPECEYTVDELLAFDPAGED
jgi:hypothetical protein